MSWPRQGSQNSLEKPKFERKSWISWDWGRACQGKLGGCPPPKRFNTGYIFIHVMPIITIFISSVTQALTACPKQEKLIIT